MVSVPSDFQRDHIILRTPANRPVCDQSKQEASNLCVTLTRSSGMGSECTKHFLEEHGRVCLSSHGSPTHSGSEVTVPIMQAHPDSPGLANKIMVLGSGGTVSRSPKTTPTNSLATQTSTEQPIPHSSRIPQPPCLVCRSTVLQNQGFTA